MATLVMVVLTLAAFLRPYLTMLTMLTLTITILTVATLIMAYILLPCYKSVVTSRCELKTRPGLALGPLGSP